MTIGTGAWFVDGTYVEVDGLAPESSPNLPALLTRMGSLLSDEVA
ncbi:hypothetical protein [Micromonospora noduli]|uniref:Uncharacterized protein n=1 Tax=Micromonospora noduli TaxID=709876 RepID=A0ABX9D946_9ACTN|nr:hypothetical protein [Micromonospora noduli]RAO08149.1 hypothetical protein LUPAC07_06079 [Micromonospora noduli]RAO20783.1 hypothetical protein GUI43_00223 [Micromonospora noduli]RAO25085.1 hypothetical protein MED15_00843 [Micromonospora noduli]